MTKLTRSYSTTAAIEKRFAKVYKYLYGNEGMKMSDLHRKVIEVGLDVLEGEQKENQAARVRAVSKVKRQRIIKS